MARLRLHPSFLRRHHAATIFIFCYSLFRTLGKQVRIIPRVHSAPWHHQERLIGLNSQDTGHIAVLVGTVHK
jgi:hypothetical protein